MDVAAEGELIEIEASGVRVVVVTRGRRGPAADTVLRGLLARATGVPADDVELVHACAECGARHGRPSVAYPLTPSGATWFADVAVLGDTVVGAAATRHPVGVGIESVALESGAVIDEAAFHASERVALDRFDPAARAISRATLWARKSALLRAVGHTEFIEPSRLALTLPSDDGGVGRIEVSPPEFGSGWRGIRFHDIAVAGNRAATVAVLS